MKRLAIVHPTTKAEDLSIGGDADYTLILEEIKRRGYAMPMQTASSEDDCSSDSVCS